MVLIAYRILRMLLMLKSLLTGVLSKKKRHCLPQTYCSLQIYILCPHLTQEGMFKNYINNPRHISSVDLMHNIASTATFDATKNKIYSFSLSFCSKQ